MTHSSMTTRLFAMVVIVLAAVSGLLSANGKQSPASGWIHAQIRVAHVTGAVTVAHAQGIIAKLYNDDSLLPGDVVITAKESSAVLVFSSGSTVSIGPASKTVVAEFTQDPFPADVILHFLRKGLETPYTVRIPVRRPGGLACALTAIRGTEIMAT